MTHTGVIIKALAQSFSAVNYKCYELTVMYLQVLRVQGCYYLRDLAGYYENCIAGNSFSS